MRRTRLFWKLYATYLVAVVLCAGVVGWFAVSSADRLYRHQAESDLVARAELVKSRVSGFLEQPAQLQLVVRRLGSSSQTRVTIIAGPAYGRVRQGTVLADSVADPATLPNHDTPDRVEVRVALTGGIGVDSRYSHTLREQMLYAALPVTSPTGGVTAVVRTALPLTEVNQAIGALARRIVAGTVLAAIAVAAIGLFVSRRLSTRMRAIQRGAERFADGDFSHELHVSSTDEIGGVAVSLNRMASQLNETIQDITLQRNERQAVLAGMTEGVLAVDDAERVITINAAAARLLGVERDGAEGRSIQETVRNPELQRFVAAALAKGDPVEDDLTLYVDGEARAVQAHGARLAEHDGGASGAVIVLNDVTRLRRYEDIRRDFVANVSHEIKTPVTSIKGFAETLLEGALDDRDNSERFLRIIAGQADRLSAIIEDLLSLSALEMGTGDDAIPLERGSVRDVLQVAVGVCEMKAAAKDITLTVDSADLVAEMNPPLLEQAVVNLIDNAVKYSPESSSVEVSASAAGDETQIVVRDHGPGIPREHLDRLFERFYRIDKARSRDLGGTGLGLAIVKHIVAAHGGTVTVESTPGLGSIFRIHLPAGG